MRDRILGLVILVGVVFGSTAVAQGPIRNLIKKRRGSAQPAAAKQTTTPTTQCVGPRCSVASPPVVQALPVQTLAPPLPEPSVLVNVQAKAESFDVEAKEPGLRRELLKAVVSARKAGKLSVREAIAIRVATFAPSFMDRVEDLCVTQMAFSDQGSEYLPIAEDGSIDRTAIDWEEFADFLERILPLILELLKAFGVLS